MDFKYLPLDSRISSFRLLRLQPSSSTDSIQCNLYNTLINEEDGRYTALSYTWGPSIDTAHQKCIRVNGFQLRVRTNVYTFLQRCVRRHDYDTFWIDAICINQNDILERNHQVAEMGEVFRSARQVYLWFGEPAEGTQQGLHMLTEPNILKTRLRLYEGITDTNEPFTESIELGLRYLLEHPYWRRVWIVPEVLVARRRVLLCGDFNFDWSELERTRRFFERERGKSINQASSLLFAHGYGEAETSGRSSLSLFTLILSYGAHECQEFHDHVYALLPLANDITDPSSLIDYSISADMLMARVIECCQRSSAEFVDGLAKSLNVKTTIEQCPATLAAYKKLLGSENFFDKIFDRINHFRDQSEYQSATEGGSLQDDSVHYNLCHELKPTCNCDNLPFMRTWLAKNSPVLSEFVERKAVGGDLERRPLVNDKSIRFTWEAFGQ